MDIVCLGEIIMDMFASETGKDFFSVSAFLPVAGGAPANVAVAAARLGAKSAFIGKAGEDPFGRRLENVLKSHGVDTRGMRFDTRYRTTLNFMTLPDANRTEMLFYRNPGADMMLEPAELDRDLLAGAAFFHFGSVSLAAEPCRSATLEAARVSRKAGSMVSFDVNYRPGLWDSRQHAVAEIDAALGLSHVAKVNEAELALLSGTDHPETGCRKILEKGPALCVATLGPRGSAWATSVSAGTAAGFAVEAVDATGAGDAFMAALLVRLLKTGLDDELMRNSLRWANAAGALTARKKGVMNALPDAKEVDELVGR
ncbi:MAG TPA: PfkB family carbohydrate kinase [Spirochaetia bacterium]|nr:PfkB family carbohydrate kinase [Spirochaetia bacterium]